MELKEVIAVFRGEIIRLEEQLKSVDMVYREQRLKVRIEALQTAISHLETLQKVREAGGVKRKTNECEFDPRVDIGEINKAERAGWNDCLDAVHAELAGKLEGLEKNMEVLCERVHKAYCKYNLEHKGEEYWTKGDYNLLNEEGKEYDRRTVRVILEAIQELFLGKKEG